MELSELIASTQNAVDLLRLYQRPSFAEDNGYVLYDETDKKQNWLSYSLLEDIFFTSVRQKSDETSYVSTASKSYFVKLNSPSVFQTFQKSSAI